MSAWKTETCETCLHHTGFQCVKPTLEARRFVRHNGEWDVACEDWVLPPRPVATWENSTCETCKFRRAGTCRFAPQQIRGACYSVIPDPDVRERMGTWHTFNEACAQWSPFEPAVPASADAVRVCL